MARPLAGTVGVDVGATKISAVRIGEDGTVAARCRRATQVDAVGSLVRAVTDVVAELRTPATAALGVGLPGLVETGSGGLAYAPAFRFTQAPVRDLLAAATGLPVVCDNDANTAAWAEHRRGAGAGYDDLVLVTVGTGLGCGVVLGGRLLRGRHGFAAEVSHLIVAAGGEPCSCGFRGCFGVEATGDAITRHARRTPGTPARWGVAEPADVTGELVTRAACRGDPVARRILAQVGEQLGHGLAALANLLDPPLLVVGGGAVEAGDLLLEPARRALRSRLYAAPERAPVPVVAARWGADAGPVGAALLAAEAAG